MNRIVNRVGIVFALHLAISASTSPLNIILKATQGVQKY